MKPPSLREQCNDVLRHLINSGAFLFRDCVKQQQDCQHRYELWQEALKKAERLIEEITDG